MNLPPDHVPAWVIGQRVTWMRAQEGGYNFIEPIAGIVRGVTAKRVKVEVATRRNGKWHRVIRSVTADKLRARTSVCRELGE